MPEPKFEVNPSVLSGETADIYFVRTVDILRREGINPVVTMEVFASRPGILCGMQEVKALLEAALPAQSREVWALAEGEPFQRKEVVLRITAPYLSFGAYETAYLGMLGQTSAWATAARECVEAAKGIPVVSFGARHVHPLMAGYLDYAAVVGGCTGCSSIVGAKLAGVPAAGTMPHALILVVGDTIQATLLFDRHTPPEVPRISLVDTFKDEVEESVRVAQALAGRLQAVRLDTPWERGRVTPHLVKEVRAALDLAGFNAVNIVVSGGIDVERIALFLEEKAPVDMFGVGSYVSSARPIDFTADLHMVAGKPVAKRGRLPGITPNPRLKRIV
jgi:nicotinate phosphoribosyltransferase